MRRLLLLWSWSLLLLLSFMEALQCAGCAAPDAHLCPLIICPPSCLGCSAHASSFWRCCSEEAWQSTAYCFCCTSAPSCMRSALCPGRSPNASSLLHCCPPAACCGGVCFCCGLAPSAKNLSSRSLSLIAWLCFTSEVWQDAGLCCCYSSVCWFLPADTCLWPSKSLLSSSIC